MITLVRSNIKAFTFQVEMVWYGCLVIHVQNFVIEHSNSYSIRLLSMSRVNYLTE